MLTFVTGPVRSGKSTLAERFARAGGRRVVYLATATREHDDPEWRARLEKHRQQRPAEWTVLETSGPGGIDAVATVRAADSGTTLLVDSFGSWIGDVMGTLAARFDENVTALMDESEAAAQAFVEAATASVADVIVVGEEVGWGVVPAYPSGRVFRDVVGRAHQKLTAAAARAYLVVCGVAIDLKAAPSLDRLAP